jgi:hypothetical protein
MILEIYINEIKNKKTNIYYLQKLKFYIYTFGKYNIHNYNNN